MKLGLLTNSRRTMNCCSNDNIRPIFVLTLPLFFTNIFSFIIGWMNVKRKKKKKAVESTQMCGAHAFTHIVQVLFGCKWNIGRIVTRIVVQSLLFSFHDDRSRIEIHFKWVETFRYKNGSCLVLVLYVFECYWFIRDMSSYVQRTSHAKHRCGLWRRASALHSWILHQNCI